MDHKKINMLIRIIKRKSELHWLINWANTGLFMLGQYMIRVKYRLTKILIMQPYSDISYFWFTEIPRTSKGPRLLKPYRVAYIFQ